MEVQVEGLDSMVAAAKKAGADVDKLITAAGMNATTRIQGNVRRRAPHRKGDLQRSVMAEKHNLEFSVKVNEKYGPYVEFGTGIYGPSGSPITPKKAKVLAFSSGGKKVFATFVKGMKARPFFKPGVEESRPYIYQQFDKVMDILMKGLAG